MEESVNNEASEQQIDDAQAEADFSAGFTGQEPAKTGEVENAATVTQAAPEQTPTAEAEPAKNVMAGLTEDQIKSLLAKASEVDAIKQELADTRDRLFGRYGEVQRTLQELKQTQAPSGGGAKITADKLKRLSAEYPEIAEMLAEDLSGLQSTTQQQPNNEQLLRLFDSKISEYEQTRELRELGRLRPDWKAEQNTDDFALFKSQLPQEERDEYDSSWDANYISGVFKKFDAWKEGAAKQSTANTQKTVEKQNRLERALQPRGTTTTNHAASDEEAFEAGFKSVRGTRI